MKKNYYLKSIIIFTVIIITCGLCGCGIFTSVDEALKANKTKSDDKYYANRNVPAVDLDLEVTCVGDESKFNKDLRVSRCVYKYLEEGDKSSLKKMFAKSVIEDKENEIDRGLDELIDYYNDLEIDGYLVESNSEYEVNKVNPKVRNIEYTYHTSFNYNGDRYILDIMYVDYSLNDDDLIGVHGLRLKNRDKDETVVVNTIETDI